VARGRGRGSWWTVERLMEKVDENEKKVLWGRRGDWNQIERNFGGLAEVFV
jgi:hypothetical protein